MSRGHTCRHTIVILGHMSGHKTDEMMTHLDGLCVAVDGKLVPASLEILVTTVLGGRGFLQGVRRLLIDIFYRNLKTCFNVGFGYDYYCWVLAGDLGWKATSSVFFS